MRNTHLFPTKFCTGSEGTSSHVSFRIRALCSSIIACFHFGTLSACVTLVGSISRGTELSNVNFGLGLTMAFLDLVCMGWMLGCGREARGGETCGDGGMRELGWSVEVAVGV